MAAVLGVVGLGPIAVGIAALALVGVLVMQRRRPALALGRARGASSGQLIGAVMIEGLVISLPPAILAAALALRPHPVRTLAAHARRRGCRGRRHDAPARGDDSPTALAAARGPVATRP